MNDRGSSTDQNEKMKEKKELQGLEINGFIALCVKPPFSQ